MSEQPPAEFHCPECGFAIKDAKPHQETFFRPWHMLTGPTAVHSYVASLGEEADEWLLALYVDEKLKLLAVDTAARGSISACGAAHLEADRAQERRWTKPDSSSSTITRAAIRRRARPIFARP